MPLGANVLFSFKGLRPAIYDELARQINVALATGTYVAGEVIGEVTATPGTFAQYATANGDGTGTAKAILQYPCVVDGSGNITVTGEFGVTVKAVPAYVGGYFFIQDTQGLDADALVDLAASIRQGSISGNSGMFHF